MEQYSEMKNVVHVGTKKDMHFIKVPIREGGAWVGQRIRDLDISRHSIIILIKRKNKELIPNGSMVLKEWDHVFMYTDKYVVDATDIEV